MSFSQTAFGRYHHQLPPNSRSNNWVTGSLMAAGVRLWRAGPVGVSRRPADCGSSASGTLVVTPIRHHHQDDWQSLLHVYSLSLPAFLLCAAAALFCFSGKRVGKPHHCGHPWLSDRPALVSRMIWGVTRESLSSILWDTIAALRSFDSLEYELFRSYPATFSSL